MSEDATFPRWPRVLLWPFKGEPGCPQMIGDLSEEFAQRAADDGAGRARRWLRREVWRTLWALVWRRETALILVTSAVAWMSMKLAVYALTSLAVLNRPLLFVATPSAAFGVALAVLLGTLLVGFAGGAIAARLQGGHERLGRLVLVAATGVLPVVVALAFWVEGKAYWTTMLSSALSVGRVAFMISLWLGSVWMQRRNRRHRAVA